MNTRADLPRWSLQDLPFHYPASVKTALGQLDNLVDRFANNRPRLSAGLAIDEFLEILHLKESIDEMGAQLGAYAYLHYAGNTHNPQALNL
jgi:oligoendopeptidase F